MTHETALEKASKSEALQDFLHETGWVDVIKPELDKIQTTLQDLLVQSVLGRRIINRTPTGDFEITKEQIAGQIDGIKTIEDIITRILREGDRAVKTLHEWGPQYQIN